MFARPGQLFIGSIGPEVRAYLASVLQASLATGYKRLVEPAAGIFAVSQVAMSRGWKPSQSE